MIYSYFVTFPLIRPNIDGTNVKEGKEPRLLPLWCCYLKSVTKTCAPLRSWKMQFSNSICTIWCIPSATIYWKSSIHFQWKYLLLLCLFLRHSLYCFMIKYWLYHVYSSRLSCFDTFARAIINPWPMKRKKWGDWRSWKKLQFSEFSAYLLPTFYWKFYFQ